MCVIVYVPDDNRRPTEEDIRNMWDTNPHGGGVAFRHEGQVAFFKGLGLQAMQSINKTATGPYALHFRAASPGLPINDELCHPFELGNKPIQQNGLIGGPVLFHNGTWHDWREHMFKYAMVGHPIPDGPMSDTRALAYIAGHGGSWDAIFEYSNQRLLRFGPTDARMFGKWVKHRGYHVTNMIWNSQWERLRYSYRRGDLVGYLKRRRE